MAGDQKVDAGYLCFVALAADEEKRQNWWIHPDTIFTVELLSALMQIFDQVETIERSRP